MKTLDQHFMKTVYQCDNCKETYSSKTWIFCCSWCGKEICDCCMYGWATCKECASSRTDIKLKEKFEE